MNLSEQEINRRNKREELMRLGIDPYPAELFDVTTLIADLRANVTPEPGLDLTNDATYGTVRLAGRLMGFRIMGSAAFAEMQDSSWTDAALLPSRRSVPR